MSRKKFSWPLKIKCMLDCAKGVTYLHTSGIMHRDLKPDNLMMVTMRFDAPVTVKITDFGATRAIGAITLGMKTAGVGTPIYMAPEVLDSKPYNTSADVYSFAMMMWYFCAEYQPYTKGTEFGTPWAVSDFVLKGKRLPIPDGTPQSLSSLMVRGWDAIPAKRPNFPTIVEFMQTILAGAIEEHQRERQSRKDKSK
jgi:serine/threonine protein kinase